MERAARNEGYLVGLFEACRSHDFAAVRAAYGVTPDGFHQLTQAVSGPMAVKRGGSLCLQSREFKALYVVSHGAFKSYVFNANGEQRIVSFDFRGEMLGVDGLSHRRHRSTTTALETSYVFRLPGRLRDIVRAVPGFGREVLELASQRVVKDQEHLLVLGERSAAVRLAVCLLDLARRQDGADSLSGDRAPVLRLCMTRRDLANFLGITPETISRLLREFERDGLIRSRERREIVLVDRDRLAALANFTHAGSE